MRTLSLVALFAAAFGALIAITTYEIFCFGESGGSTMCPDGKPSTTMTAQLVVGLAGLVPAAVMAYFAFRDARRLAVAALLVGLVLWAGWVLLNDAAVHEWGSDMRVIP
jgi:Na+/proline symporter